jgi:hypothetical protein
MGNNDHLLLQICQNDDTFKLAQDILRRAQRKTARGSGYELGSRTTGLPAICALLASHKYVLDIPFTLEWPLTLLTDSIIMT